MIAILESRLARGVLAAGIIFLSGVGAHAYYVEHKRLQQVEKELAKGQEAVLNYTTELGKEREKSDVLLDNALQAEDGPVAPVVKRYLDGLR